MAEYENDVISTKGWFWRLVLLAIPVVNIVMMFVWAFGDKNQNIKNFGKASLWLTLIAVVLYILLITLIGFGAASSTL